MSASLFFSHESIERRRAWSSGFLVAVVLSLALAAHARVALPYTPVTATPFTLIVLVAPFLVGARITTAAVALFLFGVLLGTPLFPGPSFAVMGYWVACVGVPVILARSASLGSGMLAAWLCIQLVGALWLKVINDATLLKALEAGMISFGLHDAFMAMTAYGLVRVMHAVRSH